MRLGNLITAETKINKEILIGREIEMLDETVLLLAVQEISEFDSDENIYNEKVRLLAIHEEADEEEWDDEEEDEPEIETLRDELLDMLGGDEPVLTDACMFRIYGREYDVYEAEETWVSDNSYDEALLLKRAATANVIPEQWMDKDADELYFVEYVMDPAVMDLNWNADIMPMEIEFDISNGELPVGQVMTFPCGRLDVPVAFSMETPEGETVDVKVYGTFLLDIWKDAPFIGLDFDELEEICDRDEKVLAIEYSVESAVDVTLNFYTTQVLESPAGEERPMLMLGTEDHELRMLDVVPGNFDGDVEVELFSIEIFED